MDECSLPDRTDPIRNAAIGDLHVTAADEPALLVHGLAPCQNEADLLLIAGDLTTHGEREQAVRVAEALAWLDLPKVAVLGNHDYDAGSPELVRTLLEETGGVRVLEAESAVVELNGRRVGIAGAKGFGGGFRGASASDFGEPEMKAFIRHTIEVAGQLEGALSRLDAWRKIALLHYSPAEDTLAGERRELYPFLGSYLLGDAVDRGGAALAFHGHAHVGTERGTTSGGVDVRNVALPVIKRAYKVYAIS